MQTEEKWSGWKLLVTWIVGLVVSWLIAIILIKLIVKALLR